MINPRIAIKCRSCFAILLGFGRSMRPCAARTRLYMIDGALRPLSPIAASLLDSSFHSLYTTKTLDPKIKDLRPMYVINEGYV